MTSLRRATHQSAASFDTKNRNSPPLRPRQFRRVDASIARRRAPVLLTPTAAAAAVRAAHAGPRCRPTGTWQVMRVESTTRAARCTDRRSAPTLDHRPTQRRQRNRTSDDRVVEPTRCAHTSTTIGINARRSSTTVASSARRSSTTVVSSARRSSTTVASSASIIHDGREQRVDHPRRS